MKKLYGQMRMALVKQMPCIACVTSDRTQMTHTEVHHLNLDGKAGQRRRGDRYTIPLCRWHHTGFVPFGHTPRDMTLRFGPSLARSSRSFRKQFGADDELLAETDKRL